MACEFCCRNRQPIKVHGGSDHCLKVRSDSDTNTIKIISSGLDDDCDPEEVEIDFKMKFCPEYGRKFEKGGI